MTAHPQAAEVPSTEGLPKPCLVCGAPMTVAYSPHLHTDPVLSCRYCGRNETMPAEALAQERFLRLRLMQVRRAREGIEAPMRTFEMVRQSWALGLVVFLVTGSWPLWQACQAINAGGRTPLESTLSSVFVVSGVVGIFFGHFGMVRAFRVLVRPLMLARPSPAVGLAMRCRSCGGPLPPVKASQTQCRYCGANNLLDAAGARDVGELLEAERAEYHRRATGGRPADSSLYQQPARAFGRWMAVSAGVTFVLGVAAALVISR